MKALALAAAFTAPLGSFISDLKVAPDGAAWVTEDHDTAVRVAPGGGHRGTRLDEFPQASAIGGDGQLWFTTEGGGLVRVDAGGTRTAPRASDLPDGERRLGLVAGPDGGLWTLKAGEPPQLARYLPDGSDHETPLALPPCEDQLAAPQLARASDGAVWATDWQCRRLVRITPTLQATAIPIPGKVDVTGIAADAAGGVWFSALDPVGGHATADGQVTLLPGSGLQSWSVAVAPDGLPWFATRRCTLLRANATGALERRPAPIPVEELAFDPAGGLWLASTTRVVRADASGACDERGPRFTVRRDGHGVRIGVKEPVTLALVVSLQPAGQPRERTGIDRVVRIRKRGSFRQALPKGWKLERGDALVVLLQGRDRDGNLGTRTVTLKVRR